MKLHYKKFLVQISTLFRSLEFMKPFVTFIISVNITFQEVAFEMITFLEVTLQ